MLNQYEHAWISVMSSSVPSNSESSPRCPIHLKPIQEMVSWRTRHLLPLAAAARALVQSQLPTFATRSDSFRPFPVSHIFTFTAFNIHMVCSDIQSMRDWYFDWHSAAQRSFCILLHSIKSVGRAWKSMSGNLLSDEAPSKQESESVHACEHERMLNGSTVNGSLEGIGTRFVGIKMDINRL